MKTSKPGVLIKELILEKDAGHQAEGKLLKDHFLLTYESLKPINVIKNTFKEAITSPDIKTNAVNAIMGLTTGFIVKKIFTGKSHNPLTKLAGNILEMVVASKVTKNADEIKFIAGIILKKMMERSNSEKVI